MSYHRANKKKLNHPRAKNINESIIWIRSRVCFHIKKQPLLSYDVHYESIFIVPHYSHNFKHLKINANYINYDAHILT